MSTIANRWSSFAYGTMTISAGVAAVALSVGIVAATTTLPLFDVSAVVAVAALTLWCATTRHPLRALAVVALYIGLADGFIKLRINSDPATLLRDVLLFAVLTNMLLRRSHPAAPERVSFAGSTMWVLAYAGIVLVAVANPQTATPLQAVAGLRLHLEFLPLFFVGALLVRRVDDLFRFMALLVIVGTLNSLVNLLQFNLSLDQFASWGPGYREKLFGGGVFASSARVGYVAANGTAIVRPFGLGSDVGFGGAAAALALPSCIAFAVRARTTWAAAAFGVLAIVNVVGVITCGARVIFIGAAVGAIAFVTLAALSRRALKLICLTVVVGVVATIALPAVFRDSQAGAFERLQSVSPVNILNSTVSARGGSAALIPDYAQKYFFGAGIGRSGAAFQFSNTGEHLDAETQFTFLIVETGIIGLLIMMVLHVRVLFTALTNRRDHHDDRVPFAMIALVTPILGSLATWIAAPATASTPYVCYFWFVAGIVTGFSQRSRIRS